MELQSKQFLLTFWLMFGNSCQLQSPRCGVIPLKAYARIEGGDFTEPNEFPWMASIQWSFGHGYEHHCGGSLVASRAILTAAHCRFFFERAVRDLGRPGSIRVVVGCNDYSNLRQDCHVQHVSIDSWIPHHRYVDHWKHFDDDIAVILLDKQVTGPRGAPAVSICMPAPDLEDYYGPCTVAGWGHEIPLLKHTEVEVMSARKCSNYKASFVEDKMICAGDRNGLTDACQGDSGGPLMVRETANWYQAGIVIGGKYCALKGWNGVYTKVSRHIRWIIKHTTGYGKLQYISSPKPLKSDATLRHRRRLFPYPAANLFPLPTCEVKLVPC